MSFLEVGGVQVRVLNGSPSQGLEKPGRRDRSWRGMIRDARRNLRRSWKYEAKFLDYDEAQSLQHILHGEGHMIDFKDTLSSWTGLSPLPGYNKVTLSPAGVGKLGSVTGNMQTAGAIANDLIMQYDAQLGDDWTILWWETIAATTVYKQVAISSDGTGWDSTTQDNSIGIPGSASKWGVTVVDGIVSIYLNSLTVPAMDDLVILPFKAHANHIIAWAIQNLVKYSPLPALRLSGDFVNEEYILGFGEVSGVAYLQKPADVGSLWVNNSQTVSFMLREVKTAFLLDESFDEVQAGVIVPNLPGVVAPIPNFVENP